jgi:hypothetical protein
LPLPMMQGTVSALLVQTEMITTTTTQIGARL